MKYYGMVGRNSKVKVTRSQNVKIPFFANNFVQNNVSESRQKLKCTLFSSLNVIMAVELTVSILKTDSGQRSEGSGDNDGLPWRRFVLFECI